jgi:hypothetical protein
MEKLGIDRGLYCPDVMRPARTRFYSAVKSSKNPLEYVDALMHASIMSRYSRCYAMCKHVVERAVYLDGFLTSAAGLIGKRRRHNGPTTEEVRQARTTAGQDFFTWCC